MEYYAAVERSKDLMMDSEGYPATTCGHKHRSILAASNCVLAVDRVEIELERAQAREYQIAFTMESGAWDIVESFAAASDDEANEYAEATYGEKEEWYVLDEHNHNING